MGLARSTWLYGAVLLALLAGCARGPTFVRPEDQKPIDRSVVEYPAGYSLVPYASGLTAPTAFCFDTEGTLYVAEGGVDGSEPRIFARRTDGTTDQIYPTGKRIPLPLLRGGFRLYGPIGGMVVTQGKLYVTHRDAADKGAITAFDKDRNRTTIVAGLPAEGDYSVLDIAVRPSDGRLFFGMGTATNSGVVGLDNWLVGWVRKHPKVCDLSNVDLKGQGYRFDSRNPNAGMFGGGDENAVTGAFQPFGTSFQTRIRRASDGKANGVIYSVSPDGGDLQVEAYGIHLPRGIGFNEYGVGFATNNGMEMRGTRPVKDDPDALVRIFKDTWYGWPDYSADLRPIGDPQFQPPANLLRKTGYPDLSALIDKELSNPPQKLKAPDRDVLLKSVFPSQSGAAKFDFAPSSGPFKTFSGSVMVALFGDRAPFSTSGVKLLEPTGYKVVQVQLDTREVKEFIVNTEREPASRLRRGVVALERPIDVKFGPDGAMYVLDFGQAEFKDGKTRVRPGTGRIFKLVGTAEPTTRP